MRRIPALAALLFLAACGGHKSLPDQPVPSPKPVVSQGQPSSDPAAQPSTVTTLPPEELAAEARIAADSAADAAVLDRLALAADSGPESEDGTGGADAVTWDIDVVTFGEHDRVQYYLDFFQGPGRERMNVWLGRLPRYEDMIRERLAEQGMPGDLVYLALIESGFSNSATSRARAVGMWQFMKATGRGYGLRVDRWVDDRRDPYRATHAAARHLKDLQQRFGSLYLAAAAYNAGAGRVSRGLKRLGPADEEDLPEDEAADGAEEEDGPSDADFFRLYDTRLLRRETKDYVPKLIAAALIAKEPGRYGFAPPADVEPFAYDSIIVPDMTGLDVLARLSGTTTANLRELNPRYLRLATPPGERSMVRLPVATGPAVQVAYAELPASKRVTYVEHWVRKGETMGGIARRYRVSLSALQDANPRVKPKSLRVGQRLIIPTGSGGAASYAARYDDEPRAAKGGSSARQYHRVKPGESVWSISRRYGISETSLKRMNGLRGNKVLVGQRLRVR
ncbi:MAG: LysM peptidoglycan-binding domain-containing protein [Gemmatimonadales bacterium]